MKIETKFDIGQEVWCQGEVIDTVKTKILQILVQTNGATTATLYKLKNIERVYRDFELFATKKELLDSL